MLISSFDPLRFYRWKGEILLRFCSEPYLPFNESIINKYVASENHIHAWNKPSLEIAIKSFNFSSLQAFNFYLYQQHYDVDEFWHQIDDAITSIVLSKVHAITNEFKKSQTVHLFELLLFDFIIDAEMKPYLMKISRELRHPEVKGLIEQVIYNTISIMGMDQYAPIALE